MTDSLTLDQHFEFGYYVGKRIRFCSFLEETSSVHWIHHAIHVSGSFQRPHPHCIADRMVIHTPYCILVGAYRLLCKPYALCLNRGKWLTNWFISRIFDLRIGRENLIPFVSICLSSLRTHEKESKSYSKSIISLLSGKGIWPQMVRELPFAPFSRQPLQDDSLILKTQASLFILLRIVHEASQSRWGLRVNRTVRKVRDSNSFHCLFSWWWLPLFSNVGMFLGVLHNEFYVLLNGGRTATV